MKQVIKVWNTAVYASLEDADIAGAVIVCDIPSYVERELFVRGFREGMFTAQAKIGAGTDLNFLVCDKLTTYVVEAE